jgi:tRNA (guanine-N7-)-methyltransferase
MGKNKQAQWNELASFDKVIQPEIGSVSSDDHIIKGHWKKDMFRNDNPLVLELGCGKGEYTTGLAARFPGKNFIGIDIKGARMWRGAKTATEQKLPNVAFLRTRIEFIGSFFACDEVDEIWVTFPDPHPGGRQANKRLTSPRFLNSYRTFLKNKGPVHLKTDNTELYEYTNSVVRSNYLEIIYSTNDLYSVDFESESGADSERASLHETIGDRSSVNGILSIKTHYEKLFLAQGVKINYLSFRLVKDKIINDPYRKDQGRQ